MGHEVPAGSPGNSPGTAEGGRGREGHPSQAAPACSPSAAATGPLGRLPTSMPGPSRKTVSSPPERRPPLFSACRFKVIGLFSTARAKAVAHQRPQCLSRLHPRALLSWGSWFFTPTTPTGATASPSPPNDPSSGCIPLLGSAGAHLLFEAELQLKTACRDTPPPTSLVSRREPSRPPGHVSFYAGGDAP